MDYLSIFRDKYFDIAVCDPPYGQKNMEEKTLIGKSKTS